MPRRFWTHRTEGIRVRKDGTEEVVIKMPVVDKEAGEKVWEERTGERNVWTAAVNDNGVANVSAFEIKGETGCTLVGHWR